MTKYCTYFHMTRLLCFAQLYLCITPDVVQTYQVELFFWSDQRTFLTPCFLFETEPKKDSDMSQPEIEARREKVRVRTSRGWFGLTSHRLTKWSKFSRLITINQSKCNLL